HLRSDRRLAYAPHARSDLSRARLPTTFVLHPERPQPASFDRLLGRSGAPRVCDTVAPVDVATGDAPSVPEGVRHPASEVNARSDRAAEVASPRARPAGLQGLRRPRDLSDRSRRGWRLRDRSRLLPAV